MAWLVSESAEARKLISLSESKQYVNAHREWAFETFLLYSHAHKCGLCGKYSKEKFHMENPYTNKKVDICAGCMAMFGFTLVRLDGTEMAGIDAAIRLLEKQRLPEMNKTWAELKAIARENARAWDAKTHARLEARRAVLDERKRTSELLDKAEPYAVQAEKRANHEAWLKEEEKKTPQELAAEHAKRVSKPKCLGVAVVPAAMVFD